MFYANFLEGHLSDTVTFVKYLRLLFSQLTSGSAWVNRYFKARVKCYKNINGIIKLILFQKRVLCVTKKAKSTNYDNSLLRKNIIIAIYGLYLIGSYSTSVRNKLSTGLPQTPLL